MFSGPVDRVVRIVRALVRTIDKEQCHFNHTFVTVLDSVICSGYGPSSLLGPGSAPLVREGR